MNEREVVNGWLGGEIGKSLGRWVDNRSMHRQRGKFGVENR